ncbi:hypothetical protein KSS87_000412 [Heliosperma pusillum]|nr:hypothetical protein KSS87_000412 [Heliosperma pusillum]
MASASKSADNVQESDEAVVFSAETVGNAFARHYYLILEQSPSMVYQFYQDTSKMVRAEDGSIMGSAATMDAINEKIKFYGSLKADIKCVDAQESYNGGVIVLVTGSMVNKDDSRRGFTQTFFLAPQDKGYYVLNDILRYVEDNLDVNEDQDGGTSLASPTQEEASPVPENDAAEQSNGEVYNLCENGEVKVKEEKDRVLVQEEKPVANIIDEAPCESCIVVESNVKVYTTPKKSYASIVMKDGFVSVPSPAHSKPVSKIQDQEVSIDAASVAVDIPPSSNTDTEIIGNGNNQEPEGSGAGRSIHVRNLPYHVPRSQIEEVFQRFGPIMSDGVQIRHTYDVGLRSLLPFAY